jgi:hypothetical protein
MIRPDEWDRFFAKLAERGNVTEACAASGVSRTIAHEYIRGEFPAEYDDATKEAWSERLRDAREQAADRLEAEAFRRAVDGVDEPLIGRIAKDQDGIITHVKKYSDGLLTILLKANRPDKFKDRTATELTGKDGGPVKTEAKVICLPVIDPNSPE